MKKLLPALALAFAGLASSSAMAQWNNSNHFEQDRRACSRPGVNFDRCMNQRGWDRGWGGHNQRWSYQPPRHGNNWHQPPPPPRRGSQPRLSDMQQRALDNCVLLQRSEQARCRATVMSTVR